VRHFLVGKLVGLRQASNGESEAANVIIWRDLVLSMGIGTSPEYLEPPEFSKRKHLRYMVPFEGSGAD